MARPALPTYDTEYVAFPDWLTVEEAAQMLGRTSARVRQMIENGNFKTVATIGERPVYLLMRKEVQKMAEKL